jgi:hypothetical protein
MQGVQAILYEYKLFYHSISHINNWFLQDFVDPYCIEEDRHDVPLEDCWYARPQLSFTCILRPKDGRLPKTRSYRSYKTSPDDIIYTLVFFSTFEELKLPIKGPMGDAGVIKLYEPSPTPCLNVADVQNMVGRVPLIAAALPSSQPHAVKKQGQNFLRNFQEYNLLR